MSQGGAVLAQYGLRPARAARRQDRQWHYHLLRLRPQRRAARRDGRRGGTPQAEHVWLDGVPLAMLKGGQVSYVHPDRLGTPRLVTDAAGTPVWRWVSDPFGTTQANQDPDGDGIPFAYNLRLPGQYFDAETGLHYNMARYYDSAVGAYRESDPIGLRGGVNTYI